MALTKPATVRSASSAPAAQSAQSGQNQALRSRYAHVRAQTLALAQPLTPEDCQAQSMPDASPVKWHLAHVTWFFETMVLEAFEPGFRPFDPAFRVTILGYLNNTPIGLSTF